MSRAQPKCQDVVLPEAHPIRYDALNEQETRRLIELAFQRRCGEPDAEGCPLFCDTGSPEGVVTSPIGGMYEQTDAASTSHAIWIKHTGVGNTGWRAWNGMRGGAGANTALRMGDDSVASGANSMAFGEGAAALGAAGIAIGKDAATPNKVNAIAIGETQAVNEFEINIGKNNTTKAKSFTPAIDILIGLNNDNSGGSSSGGEVIMIGSDNIAETLGDPIILIGFDSEIHGYEVVAIGNFTLAADGLVSGTAVDQSSYGVMIGTEVEAQADCFIAIGYQALAYGIGACAVGPHTRAGNNADSLHTTALGRTAVALADKSLALGSSTSIGSSHTTSIALGHLAATNAAAQLMIGAASSGNRITAVHFNGSSVPAMIADSSGNVGFMGVLSSPVTNSSSTTINVTTIEGSIFSDATAGNVTVNLFTAVGQAGRIITIQKTDATANTVTIDAFSSQTINGATTKVLTTQYESVTLQSDGSNWRIIG